MKQKFTLSWLALTMTLLLFGGGKTWGDSTTSTFTDKNFSVEDGNETWTASGLCSYVEFDNSGVHIGSGSVRPGFTLESASTFSNVIKVTINAKTSKGTNVSIAVKIGNEDFNSGSIATPSSATGYTDYFFASSAKSGKIKITGSSSATKGIWIKSITITTASPIGTFSSISDIEKEVGDSWDFTPSFTKDENAEGTPTITVTPSSGSSVANYDSSTGKITAVGKGKQEFTVTATPDTTDAGSYVAVSKTFTVSVSAADARTAVNMTGFTAASTTIVKGNTTTTTVTNDQSDWTAAYSYSSSDETVATVSSDGVITGVAKGTATITAALNVDGEDVNYKRGETYSKTLEITVNNPSHTATFMVNGSSYSTDTQQEGDDITFPTNPDDINGMSFYGWYEGTYSSATTAPTPVTSATMGTSDRTFHAVFGELVAGNEKVDVLNQSVTGVTGGYNNFSGKTAQGDNHSDAVYAGQCAGSYSSIQLRTDNSNSGVISTAKAGPRITKVVVVWNSNTTSGRQIDIYGKNTSYSAVSDLYGDSQGTLLGSVKYGTSTALSSVTGDYEYIGIRSSNGALYLTSITIYYGTPDSWSNFSTTVSSLPRPTIAMSASDIDMTWGDTDKTLTATATMNDEELDETVTLTSSSDDLTIDGSGNIRCDVPGNYTITASLAATSGHQAAYDVVCNVTVGKKDASLSFADATVLQMKGGSAYTQTATKSPAAAGDVTYTISPSGNDINSATGAVTLSATGNYTVTATAAANTLYNEAVASYTLQVREEPTIVVNTSETISYGETFTLDDDMIEGGDISMELANPAIASIDGLTLTPTATGTTTVTVRTAANDQYIAGEETFTLTVTKPDGGSTAKASSVTTTFTNASLAHNADGLDWTGTASGFESTGNNRGVQWTSNFTLSSESDSKVKKVTVVASSNNASNTLAVAVGGTSFKNNDATTVTIGNGTVNQSFEFTGTGDGSIVITGTRSGNSIWIKSVIVEMEPVVPITLNSAGYATFCSEYPLDFSTAEDVTAWQVTSTTGGTVTFGQVTGSIKGGIGILLKGEAGATVNIPSVNSTNMLSENMFEGTLAPYYLSQTADGTYTYFGLKGNEFVMINPGTIAAHKAFLPVPNGDVPAEGKLNIVFNDETAIRTIASGSKADVWYDLQGRRVMNPTKGLYIHNGKKVVK